MKNELSTQKTINDAVFNGIRKTINRFREKPFIYFTESDIHASLSKDIMERNSDLFVIGKKIKGRSIVKTPISLVHHEYPTNFRFNGTLLKTSDSKIDEIDSMNNNVKSTDRGHYDLAVLNPSFIDDLCKKHPDNIMDAMKHIINKNNSLINVRGDTNNEVLFAIEVKFIHTFNAGNKTMINEVKKDIHKLQYALKFSENFIKPIVLIFCSSDYVQSNNYSVIKKIKDDLGLNSNTNQGICTVFIESFFSKKNSKNTPKPLINFNPIQPGEDWTTNLKRMLLHEL
jgi:hypothetical protein